MVVLVHFCIWVVRPGLVFLFSAIVLVFVFLLSLPGNFVAVWLFLVILLVLRLVLRHLHILGGLGGIISVSPCISCIGWAYCVVSFSISSSALLLFCIAPDIVGLWRVVSCHMLPSGILVWFGYLCIVLFRVFTSLCFCDICIFWFNASKSSIISPW